MISIFSGAYWSFMYLKYKMFYNFKKNVLHFCLILPKNFIMPLQMDFVINC
jgi:hypothetical protein